MALQPNMSRGHDDPTTSSSSPPSQRSLDYSTGNEHGGKLERETKNPQLAWQESHFFARTKDMARARAIYMKAFVSGAFLVVLTIFIVFPIYWGALWKIPDHPLNGWVVDFDGGEVGDFFVQNIIAMSNKAIIWSEYPASSVGSLEKLQNDITEEKAWVAVAINAGASNQLNNAIQSSISSYNGSLAMTVYAAEARNENAYRNLIFPTVSQTLDKLSDQFALDFAQRLSSSIQPSAVVNILAESPQVLVLPASYTLVNLLPFDEPVASAATFVGLIYTLILSFYIVIIGDGARNASGMTRLLSFGSLVRLRLTSSVLAYFFLSLFYSLINVAFQIDFTRKFGHAGFVVYWMVNWAGMMAVGLALESLVTILTTRFIPFFMIFWIICNVSVCVYPIQTLPRIFHYGYAAPFYNVSRAFRTIAFKTKNQIGLNVGILVVWIVISCITLPLFQWIVWKRNRENGRGR